MIRTVNSKQIIGAPEVDERKFEYGLKARHKEIILSSQICPMHPPETLTWDGTNRSWIHVVEMKSIKRVRGVSTWDGESSNNVYYSFGARTTARGVGEWIQHCTPRWFKHAIKKALVCKEYERASLTEMVSGGHHQWCWSGEDIRLQERGSVTWQELNYVERQFCERENCRFLLCPHNWGKFLWMDGTLEM